MNTKTPSFLNLDHMNAEGITPAKLSAIADLMETLVVPDGTDEAPEDGLLQIGTVVKFIAWNPLMIGTIVAYIALY